ncbi:hypothetical protein ATN84_24370 [Paramesorhizobium deserti]|uniref:AprE-like beta-barrel domain-containing protein n=1 Tax=Paramesorhizobium deserti TaxID=1494590 RepID=A0A135HXP2_9HYPH|nr:HlyD family efflux transporter periplasmic adaptor subunit [Paramesorhizobium deserti]KXF77955.1 hypothetical protein ATN84_24370 [Paramesorhizobium deserti]
MGVFAMAVIVGVLTLCDYTRRVRVSGVVTPSTGVTHIFAPQPGRVISEAVVEGAFVRRGDELYTVGIDYKTGLGITEEIVKAQLLARKAELEAAISQRAILDEVDKKGLFAQGISTQNEIERVDAQINQAEEYIAFLGPQVEKYRNLVGQGITTQREFEYRQQTYIQTRQELESLKRQRVQLVGHLSENRTRIAGFDANAALLMGELRQRIASIEEQLAQGEARHAIVVTSPRDGTVAAVLARSGQMVAAGTELATILPANGQMEVHLLAESSAIGFVQKGVGVLLRYAAFPYQKFGQYPGTVTEVSRVTLAPNEQGATFTGQRAQNVPRYRITVQPDKPFVRAYGKPEPLRAGMTVEADLLLDTRPLYQWLFEPLYSLRGKIVGSAPGFQS